MNRNAGIEATVIDYLKDPPSRVQLSRMIADAGLTVRQAIREKGTPMPNSLRSKRPKFPIDSSPAP